MKYNFITEIPYPQDEILKGELYIDTVTAQDLGRKQTESYELIKFKKVDDYMEMERKISIQNFQPQILQDFIKKEQLFLNISSHYYGYNKRIDFIKIENFPKLEIVVQRDLMSYDEFKMNRFQKYQFVDAINKQIDYFKQFKDKINIMMKKCLKVDNLKNWKQELQIQPSIIKTSIMIRSDYELANQFFYDLSIQLMEILLVYWYKNLILFSKKWKKMSLQEIIELIKQKQLLNQFQFNQLQPIFTFEDLKKNTNFFVSKNVLQQHHYEDVQQYLDVIKEGQLLKKGEGPFDFGWNQRYFVIKGKFLQYYENKEDQQIKGQLNMYEILISAVEQKDDKYIINLSQIKKNRIVQIASLNKEKIQEWHDKLILLQTRQFQLQDNQEENKTNKKIKKFLKIPSDFNYHIIDWEFYKVKNNIKFFYQKKDLQRFKSFPSLKDIKLKFDKQLIVLFIAFLLAFKFIGLLLSICLFIILLGFKLKKIIQVKYDDKTYIKGETIIKGKEEDLLLFMQNPNNLKNWNNNISNLNINKHNNFSGKLRTNQCSIKGSINILEKGVYISYKYYDKGLFEIEQILLLNKTPVEDVFILEYIIKSNIQPKDSFQFFFKQLETSINTLSFLKNNFKYIQNGTENQDRLQIIQNEEQQFYLEGEPFLEQQIYQFDQEKKEIMNISNEEINNHQIPATQNQQLNIENIKIVKKFFERFSEENYIEQRNLLTVNYPTTMMMGKSIFQILAEMFKPLTLFASYFQDCEDQESNFYYLIAGILGGLFQVIVFKKIPFIPIPGETAQYIFPDNSILNFEMLNDQKLAFLLFNQNTGFLTHGKIHIQVKFSFNHIKVVFSGKINLYPGERSTNKIYKIDKVLLSQNYLEIEYPELALGDLMSGQLNWHFENKLSISMPSKQIKCFIHFKKEDDKIWEHFKLQKINGYIITFKNDLLKEITGQWPFYLKIGNNCVWKNVLTMPNYQRTNRFLPSDSSIREDIIDFNNDNLNQNRKFTIDQRKFVTKILRKNIKNQFKQQQFKWINNLTKNF